MVVAEMRPEIEKVKREEITITKSRKKTEKKKNRKSHWISVKSDRKGGSSFRSHTAIIIAGAETFYTDAPLFR